MNRPATWAVAALLATAVGVHGPCLAGENSVAAGPGSVLGALAGAAVSTAELGQQHGRGIKDINVNTNYTADTGSALSAGSLKNNSVIGTSDTGMITTTGSVNNNTGITTSSRTLETTRSFSKPPRSTLRCIN